MAIRRKRATGRRISKCWCVRVVSVKTEGDEVRESTGTNHSSGGGGWMGCNSQNLAFIAIWLLVLLQVE